MEYYSAIKRNEITAFAVTRMNLEITMLNEVSETPMLYAITYMWNLKKGYNKLLCRTDTDPQTLKNLWFPKETVLGDALGVWNGNAIKLGCDDYCTTINIIKFTEFFFFFLKEPLLSLSWLRSLLRRRFDSWLGTMG